MFNCVQLLLTINIHFHILLELIKSPHQDAHMACIVIACVCIDSKLEEPHKL